jgi:hypothetical protein
VRPEYLRKRKCNNGGNNNDFFTSPYWNFKTSLKPKTTDRIFHTTYVQRSQIKIKRQAKNINWWDKETLKASKRMNHSLKA